MDTRPETTAAGIGRRDVLVAGASAALSLTTLTEPVEAAAAAKSGWRWCNKCDGLFAGQGADAVGVCPTGGRHKPVSSFNYLLLSGLSATHVDLIHSWFQCKKCRGLVAPEGTRNGVFLKAGRTRQPARTMRSGRGRHSRSWKRTGRGAPSALRCTGPAAAVASVPLAGCIRPASTTN
jgi:hypothetical protein